VKEREGVDMAGNFPFRPMPEREREGMRGLTDFQKTTKRNKYSEGNIALTTMGGGGEEGGK
jgi:hypothetical protein